MRHKIDCLLIAYSGWSRNDEEDYKTLVQEAPAVAGFSKPLNAAITYLGTSLNAEGFTFEFINEIEDEKDRLVHLLQTYEIGSIGISTSLVPDSDVKYVIELVNLIKEIDSKPPIILGGAFIKFYIRILERQDEEFMQSSLKALNVDFIVDSTYGEEKLPAILSRLRDGLPVDDIPNLYVNDKGHLYRTEKKAEEYVLKQRKINWQLFKEGAWNTISVRTSVSCVNSCKFCTYPIFAGKYNNVDLTFIEQQLNSIQELGKVDFIMFIDDTFNIPAKRFKEILRMMIRNKYTFKWHSYIRCQVIDEETVKMMKDSGCTSVFMGIESGSDAVLESMNKKANAKQYKRGMELLKNNGIPIVTSFFIGFPGETEATAEETVRFIEETKPDFYYLHTWVNEELAPILAQREQYNIQGDEFNWSHKDMDSETASQIVLDAKKRIKNSICLGYSGDDSIYQMIARMELAQVKSIFSKPSLQEKILKYY